MSNETGTTDFSGLIADTKEYLSYLQELGVENLKVELPNEKFILPEKAVVVPEKPKIEKYVPTEVYKPIEQPVQKIITNNTQKNVLASTKLSNLFSKEATGPEGTKPIKPEQIFSKPDITNQPINQSNEMLFESETNELPESNETLEQIQAEIGDCRRCGLCEGRTNIAHSTGNPTAKLMFVGEAPGADEDAQGKPFVGRAGQLLTKIIEAIGISREEVFIGNINRCRPPQNRAPLPDETKACKPFLMREIAVVKPKVVVVLGNTAMKNLLDTKEGITKLRGIFQDYYGVKVMPTFHPAYLLRDPSKKREVWEDMKKIRDYLNEIG